MAGSNEITARFKMVLFGKEAVGKTSLVDRYINDKFEQSYISTLGYNVFEKVIRHGTALISLMIYDIGGQEKFREIRKKYADGADLAFIVYDISVKESFDVVPDWRKDLSDFSGEAAFILIGNKDDLATERQVSTEEGTKLASELGALDFFETSAKTGKGVEKAFAQIAKKTYDLRFK